MLIKQLQGKRNVLNLSEINIHTLEVIFQYGLVINCKSYIVHKLMVFKHYA